MTIFSGSSNKPLTQKIAKHLNISHFSLDVHIFPDGEQRIRVSQDVFGQDTIIVQSAGMPTDQHYMELFFAIDALKRSGAKSVTAVIPYLGYQRQDHVFVEGEARSMEVIGTILLSLGAARVITGDLHSVKIIEIFKIPLLEVSALPLFAKLIKENKWNDTNTVLVSPDMGGIRRIKILSKMLDNMPYAVIEKNRDLATGKVKAHKIEGQIGERAIIVDDIISTGATIVTAANLLINKGAKNIYVFATHAVFSKDAPKILSSPLIKKVYVTDTIDVPKSKRFPKLEVLSVSQMISNNLKA